ncbi:MAG: PQQ-binding-like beta-propeller repeat protein [Verrucomicrobia bacterium]|nr:PQQ-binding-like beta-propeller repeat protein [Verrucomicrobiota bacterium]
MGRSPLIYDLPPQHALSARVGRWMSSCLVMTGSLCLALILISPICHCVASDNPKQAQRAKRVFEKAYLGSTGYQPVLSGDSPDATRAASVNSPDAGLTLAPAAIPVGKLPTGAGRLPAPPILKTGSTTPVEEWPMFKHDLRRSGYSPSKAPDTASVVWQTRIPEANKFWSSPCVAGGKLYIGNNNGNLYCLDALTGKRLWTFFTETYQPIFSSPAVHRNAVYFAGYEMIYAIPGDDPDHDGVMTVENCLWRFRVGKSTGGVNNVVASSPAIKDGKLFLGAVDQYFYCFDAVKGGHPLWETFTRYRGQHAFSSSPALDGGRLFAATGNQSGSGRLYCFNEANGDILWEFDIDDITFASPVIDGNRVFISNSGDWIGGNRRYRLYCLDVNGFLDGVDDGVADSHRGNADLVWSFDTRDYVYSSPSIHQGRLYFGCANGVLTCLDAKSGKALWVYPSATRSKYTQPRGILSSPAIADGKVFIGTIEGRLVALPETDPNGDGVISPDEVVWSFPIGGDGVCSPVVSNGCVYAGNHQGTIFCFGPNGPNQSPK